RRSFSTFVCGAAFLAAGAAVWSVPPARAASSDACLWAEDGWQGDPALRETAASAAAAAGAMHGVASTVAAIVLAPIQTAASTVFGEEGNKGEDERVQGDGCVYPVAPVVRIDGGLIRGAVTEGVA